MNFIKLKNNFTCNDYDILEEQILYGKKFNNDFEGILYSRIKIKNDRFFYQIIPEKYKKHFFLLYMHIKLHNKKEIPPHTDSGIKSCINFYIKTNNEKTEFFSVKNNENLRQIKNQTNGYIFDRNDLILENYFIAGNNESFLLDVSKPHAILANKNSINRTAITLQSKKYFFKDVCNMLIETNSI